HATARTMNTPAATFAYAFEPPEKPQQKKDSLFRPELLPTIIDPDLPFDLFGRQWIPIRMVHGRFEVLGFRIGNFAYCTDCNLIPPAGMQKLRNLDVLIIDALRPRPHPTHLSFEQALAVVAQLQPKRAFFKIGRAS